MENDIRKWMRLIEGIVPVVLYHGTFRHHLPSIKQHGLGGKISRRNFDISGTGVSLVDDPDVADNWASDNEFGNQGDVVVLAIDTAKLDLARLSSDPNDEGERGGTSFHYHGIIPADALSVLT
jgi:RNA:NAD 2'-phosphotransferase (TPT1/KptA family)